MISILIPIYNRSVVTLVDRLYDQCSKLGIPFEFLCYDDVSQEKYKAKNRSIGQKMGISYIELSNNLGRAKIRNWLGKNARYEWLIFMDCDSGVDHATYVKKYVESIGKADLVYGGTSYQKKAPAVKKRLHWKYGKNVEAESIQIRRNSGFDSFRSNNFMISRDVFMEHLFDESIEGYGYEDILMAQEMKQMGKTILHIDNPLVHKGLENRDVFLKKTEKAIWNLSKMYSEGKLKTRLTRHYEKLVDWGLLPLIKFLDSKLIGSYFQNRLQIDNPSIFALQWFKLQLFVKFQNEPKDE